MQDQQQPGMSFQPGQQFQPQPEPQPQQQPAVTPVQPAPLPQTPQPATQPPSHMQDDGNTISWTASEYIAHEKGGSWFVQFVLVAIVATAVAYFITRSIFTVAVFVIFAIGFIVLAKRKPQVLQYQLSDDMIRVGDKTFSLHSFKSFAIIDEGNLDSISLLPLKRFMPALDIYFAPEDEDRITDLLSQSLPMEHRTQDMLDKFMQKIRF